MGAKIWIFISTTNGQSIPQTYASQYCIEGGNCPINRGICQGDTCVCMYGYKTLSGPTPDQTIYCNYEQYSRWKPFIFELFVPSIGLILIHRFTHGFIKLFIMISLLYDKVPRQLVACGFFILYVVDLICLLFAIYKDGNGIPLL